MPNIKPTSELRNYNNVPQSCQVGEPEFLTKLAEAEEAIETGQEWKSLEDLRKALEDLE